MALVSALDPDAPNDYFLFIGNDNDFLTQSGKLLEANGELQSYDAGLENDTMVLAFRVSVVPEPPTWWLLAGGSPLQPGWAAVAGADGVRQRRASAADRPANTAAGQSRRLRTGTAPRSCRIARHYRPDDSGTTCFFQVDRAANLPGLHDWARSEPTTSRYALNPGKKASSMKPGSRYCGRIVDVLAACRMCRTMPDSSRAYRIDLASSCSRSTKARSSPWFSAGYRALPKQRFQKASEKP